MQPTRKGTLTVIGLLFGAAALAVFAGQARRRITIEAVEGPVDFAGDMAFVDVNLVTMLGDTALTHHTVLVHGEMIVALGPADSIAVPQSAFRVDGSGSYLMPGLTDAHTHVAFEEDLLLYLANGVTTIVNLGNEPDVPILEWRDEVAAGERLGPTLFVARFVDGARRRSRIRGAYLLSTPEAARVFVSETKSAGYDLIKAYNSLSLRVYSALMEEAAAQGIAVVGHGVRAPGMQGLLEAGQVMVAHAEEYLYTHFRRSIDPALIPSAVDMTLEAGAYVVPNLSAYEIIALQWGKPRVLERLLELPELGYVHPFWRKYWARGRYISRQGDLISRLEFLRELTAALNEAGVPLLLGTDSPSIPGMLAGFSIHDDLRNLVESGLTPYEALRAGTRNPGKFLNGYVPGSAPFGMIQVGQRADLILLRDDPLASVENLKGRVGVMVRGRWLNEARLQELMAGLADSFSAAESDDS